MRHVSSEYISHSDSGQLCPCTEKRKQRLLYALLLQSSDHQLEAPEPHQGPQSFLYSPQMILNSENTRRKPCCGFKGTFFDQIPTGFLS